MHKYLANLTILALPLVIVSGCGDSGGVHVSNSLPGQGDHTPHTDIEQGIWPPQPLGMTGALALPASAKVGALQSVVNAARGVVMQNPNVRGAIGDNFIEFDGSPGDSKSSVSASFLLYSYSFDETVEVVLQRSGEVTFETFQAVEYQPSEHAIEVTRAISLGRQNLINSGFEVAGLSGTAMLAFPPLSELTNADEQYYPQRIMYVTFGPGDGELPIYSALVNLSDSTVSDGGLVK